MGLSAPTRFLSSSFSSSLPSPIEDVGSLVVGGIGTDQGNPPPSLSLSSTHTGGHVLRGLSLLSVSAYLCPCPWRRNPPLVFFWNRLTRLVIIIPSLPPSHLPALANFERRPPSSPPPSPFQLPLPSIPASLSASSSSPVLLITIDLGIRLSSSFPRPSLSLSLRRAQSYAFGCITAAFTLGGLVGSLSAGSVVRRLDVLKTLQLASACVAVGSAAIAVAPTGTTTRWAVSVLLVAR